MKTWQKRSLIGLATTIAVLILLFTISFYPFIGIGNMCANTILSTIPITGSKYKIVVFERNCGATTGFSTQASILKEYEELTDEGGNIFIADTDHGKAPSSVGGGPELRIKIIASDTIELSYDYRARIFLQEKIYQSVKIKYSTFGSS